MDDTLILRPKIKISSYILPITVMLAGLFFNSITSETDEAIAAWCIFAVGCLGLILVLIYKRNSKIVFTQQYIKHRIIFREDKINLEDIHVVNVNRLKYRSIRPPHTYIFYRLCFYSKENLKKECVFINIDEYEKADLLYMLKKIQNGRFSYLSYKLYDTVF